MKTFTEFLNENDKLIKNSSDAIKTHFPTQDTEELSYNIIKDGIEGAIDALDVVNKHLADSNLPKDKLDAVITELTTLLNGIEEEMEINKHKKQTD
jgi:hypothetical protein